MYRWLKAALKTKFIKNVSILVTGTITSQILILITMPLITRLYGPHAYGLMGIFVSIFSLVIPIAALTFPTAIVLPKEKKEALKVVKISFLSCTALSIFFLVILFFLNKELAQWLNIVEYSFFLFLIPIVILTAGINQVLRQWLIRNEKFNLISRNTIQETFLVYGTIVAIGFIFPNAIILILLMAAKTGISSILLIKKGMTLHPNSFKFFIKENNKGLKKVFKKYKDFPSFRAPQELINSITQGMPILLLATFFGPASAGFYSLGRTALSIPSRFIGNAIGDVFYPRISRAANNNENLTKIITKATLILFFIALIPFSIVIVFGPAIFEMLFGEEWKKAGEYARWLSIWLLFNFANKPSIKALPVLSAQSFHLKFTIMQLIIRVLALVVGFQIFESDIMAIILFSSTGAILEILLIYSTLLISKRISSSQ